MNCQHTETSTRIMPFFGPVSRDENPSAHGGVCIVETCACGSMRKMNLNNGHREAGSWFVDPKHEERAVLRRSLDTARARLAAIAHATPTTTVDGVRVRITEDGFIDILDPHPAPERVALNALVAWGPTGRALIDARYALVAVREALAAAGIVEYPGKLRPGA
jgi:hypothetical protein